MTLFGSPHLYMAGRSRPAVLFVGWIFAAVGFLMQIVVLVGLAGNWGAYFHIPGAIGYLGASLLVAAAGLVSAGIVAQDRSRAIVALGRFEETVSDDVVAAQTASDGRHSEGPVETPRWLTNWPQEIAAILLGAAAIESVFTAWGLNDLRVLSPQMQQVFGGLLILLGFPFLVLERAYANATPEAQPDAPQVERLLRVPLVTFVGLGITSVLFSVGFDWPSVAEWAIAILIGLVSLELVLRGVACGFMPVAPISTRRSIADSTIAGLLRLSPPTFTAVGTAVKRQLGIDLSRSWALAFVRRATLPIGLGMAVFAWCMTGVTALGLNERAVYERFGAPAAIFGPGLHVHLPWPLGIMHRVELGVVHEIPIIFSPFGEQGTRADKIDQIQQEAAVEDLAPASADRLWDASHPSEASYLIASESQGKQSFQIVNIDLRVVYRVGLSDAEARDAAYAIADPEALIRALSGQLLVRYFARYTLLDVLGQSRERFTSDFRRELQDRLQGLSTGIEVIAVVVEAIHPPPGAAKAYHNVQAAEILAQSQISLHRADAINAMKTSQATATDDRNRALAAAAELVNKAQAESVLFEGDRQAYHQDGWPFLFERWLDRLSGSLPKSSFIAIDHRLTGVAAPTIDLRSFQLPGAAYETIPARPVTPSTKPSAPSTIEMQGGAEGDDAE